MHNLHSGVYAAALTPLHADLRGDWNKLAEHCLALMQRGCSGVALFGTTGEGPSFSVAERIEGLKKVVAEGVDPKQVILGNGSAGVADTVELCRAAIQMGCAALLISPPCFFKHVSDEGVVAYYREVFRRVGDSHIRVILYHIPQFTGVPLSPREVGQLRKEFPKEVMGFKESEGNLPLLKSILKEFPDLKVFAGSERCVIEAVHVGAAGTICGMGNLYPELMCSLYNQGARSLAPNPPALEAFLKASQKWPFVAAFKAVMEMREGACWRELLPPLQPLTQEQKEHFFQALQEAGLEK